MALGATVFSEGPLSAGGLALAVALAGLVLAVGAGALWLAVGTTEYRLETRRLTRRRRFLGREWTRVLEPVSLVLGDSTDSDGDHHHRLVARGAKDELVLDAALHDARKLVHLGRWIGARVGSRVELLRA